MKIKLIRAGDFKLDGGAMFGVVPKQLWQKKVSADSENLCNWTMRSLLIEYKDRTILVDTGIGTKQDAKFRSHFHPTGSNIEEALHQNGYSPEAITDVFLTHLHFDHVGGAVKYNEEGMLVPTFPNATYWSNASHWKWAKEPNAREKASFLKENFLPLEEHEVIQFLEEKDQLEWLPNIRIRYCYGHTEALMLLDFDMNGQKVVYMADLIPSYAHVSMPWVMAYDVRPLKTLEEKEKILQEVLDAKGILLFEHDAQYECATIKMNQRGRIQIDQLMRWEELDF